MARKHTPTQTSPEERRRYNKDGQQDFGWENPKITKIRDAVKSRTMRSKKAAQRSYARPTPRRERRRWDI